MKKLIFLLTALLFSALISNAQTDTIGKKQNAPTDTTGKKQTKLTDTAMCYLMKDGKMHKVVQGKETLLSEMVTLENGETIMPNGAYKLKDGQEMKLTNGQCIDASGRLHKSHAEDHKKM